MHPGCEWSCETYVQSPMSPDTERVVEVVWVDRETVVVGAKEDTVRTLESEENATSTSSLDRDDADWPRQNLS